MCQRFILRPYYTSAGVFRQPKSARQPCRDDVRAQHTRLVSAAAQLLSLLRCWDDSTALLLSKRDCVLYRHWHSCTACVPGVPGAMRDTPSTLFSARWQTRLETTHELLDIRFSSHASGGSRVIFDEVIVLDAWEEPRSTVLVSDFLSNQYICNSDRMN